jgi:YidC/Oxa1 family membrane protein insertase
MPTTRRSGRRALVAPAAALGSEAAETLMHIAPHVDAAATLAAQRVVDLSDAATVALDPALAASSFADAMEAVNGVSSPDAASSAAIVAPERMEGILSPISDRLEAFVLGTQDVFAKQGVPYPLGSAIIFTTFCVKALTYPFTKSQVEATLNLQNLAPQTDAIREKYANDQERMNVEINRLYEENQVSPLAGCVPILLTLPVVWGLYRAFNNASIDGSFDEPWFFIPSLAGPDPDRTLAWLLPLDENYAPPIGWHDASLYLVVPVLTVLSQYVSMNLLQPPKDPTKEEDENQSVLLQLLPLFIGYISLTVPAGLTLYWLFNNIFTTATQVYLREGGGAVAKIEKSEDFKIKVPLGCAVVDPSIMDTKPRDAPCEGPYVIWGEGSAGNDTSDDVGGTDSADLASAAAGGFYVSAEAREAETKRWTALLSDRGKRARNPADRATATVAELRAVVEDFESAGRTEEAAAVARELVRVEALGGDAYAATLAVEGEKQRKVEEERAMRESLGSNGGLPTMEDLEKAIEL